MSGQPQGAFSYLRFVSSSNSLTCSSDSPKWRTIGALNALTGQVSYLDGYIVGRRQVMQFYAQLDHTYPAAELL